MVFKKETLLSVQNPVFGPVTVVSKRIDTSSHSASNDRCIALLDGKRKQLGNVVYNVRPDHIYIYNIGASQKKAGVGGAISAIIAHYEKKPVELVAESELNRKIFGHMGFKYLETVQLKGRKGYRMRLPLDSGLELRDIERKLSKMGIPKAD